MFYNRERAKELSQEGQLVLCKCPEWCVEGFQVATWNGTKFEYSLQPNDNFDSTVTEFMILSQTGRVIKFQS